MAERIDQVLEQFQHQTQKMKGEIAKAIVGQEDVIKQLLACIFARGHCLMIGVPGLAKTATVVALSKILALTFKRVQFTPDLMPSDITGTNVIDDVDGKREFRFVPGPLFAHIVLADEINRTPPKTQAALLEAMQERQVTVGQSTYPLPKPFFVIATQNPIEQEGTYPLPEAQQDRFMFSVVVDYPNKEEEAQILELTTRGIKPDLGQVMTAKDILLHQKLVEKITVSKFVMDYVTSIVRATRPKTSEAPPFVRDMVEWGAGPRAGQYLVWGGKVMAAMAGRLNVSCQDVRDVAIPVLRHRIATNFQAQSEGIDSVVVVKKLLETIEEPRAPKYV